ncbi:lysophospholipid acyltransferase family protein [Methyloparacoccus murrellii]
MVNPLVVLRSAVYLTGQVLSTLILGPVMLLLSPWPFATRYAAANRWVRWNLWLLRTVCGLSYRVTGAEHIPAEGSGLILCKHQSAFETLALQVIFPPVVFILKQELLRIPVWGWAMATLEPIAIDRQARSVALKQILRDGVKRIATGRWVVLFPEGTRVAPGQRGRFGSSGGLLAQRARCPVIPVAHNAGEFWGRNGFLKYPGVIEFRVGPAIHGADLTATEINAAAESWIESEMARISGQGPRFPGRDDGIPVGR